MAPLEGIDPTEFRACMALVPNAVAIITCGTPGARTGLTATALCSLTDMPPMLLACVNANASAHAVIRSTGCFAANIVADRHTELAQRFAGRTGIDGEQRFTYSGWAALKTGAPVLDGAIASFDCVLEAEHRHASHSIFIGRVVAAVQCSEAEPLLYRNGQFGCFAAS
ncbi:MAG: flavin reductase family protein [Rhodospirillales bacterium]|nr:flavin reductase family protein [Rhodospirillales bacterium]